MTGVLIIVVVTKWRKSDVVTWVGKNDKLIKAKSQPLICSDSYMNEINQFQGMYKGLFNKNQWFTNIYYTVNHSTHLS